MDIISLVGLPGSGKSTVAQLLKKYGYAVVRLGDITDHELRLRELDPNDENAAIVLKDLREKIGPDVYVKLSMPEIEKYDKVVIDGVRNWEEVQTLRNEFLYGMRLIAITADEEVRHQRLMERPTRSLTKEECVRRDKREIEELRINDTISNAELAIVNNGTIAELEHKLEEIFLRKRPIV